MAERGQPETEQGTVMLQSGKRGGTWDDFDELACCDFASLMLRVMQGKHVEWPQGSVTGLR